MKNTAKITSLKLILVTPVFILLSHYLAVFPHEYAHSFMAWLLGFKNNPLVLTYGGISRKGNCWDNSVAESFFHIIKTELIHDEQYLVH